MAVPLGGESRDDGIADRQPPGAALALNLDPLQKGAWRQRRGFRSCNTVVAVGGGTDWAGVPDDAQWDAVGGVRRADGGYSYLAAGRVFDTSARTAPRAAAPRYADVSWATDELAALNSEDSCAYARCVEYTTPDGAEWRVVATAHTSTTWRMVVQFFMGGTLVRSDVFQPAWWDSTVGLYRNLCRIVVSDDNGSGSGRVAVVLPPVAGHGNFEIAHWDWANPQGGVTTTGFSSTDCVVDLCAALGPNGGRWSLVMATDAGSIYDTRLVLDFSSTSAPTSTVDAAALPARSVVCCPSMSQSLGGTWVAIVTRDYDGTREYARARASYGNGTTKSAYLLRTAPFTTEEMISIDVQPYSSGYPVGTLHSFAASVAWNTTSSGERVLAASRFWQLDLTAAAAPAVAWTNTAYGTSCMSLLALGDSRVVAACVESSSAFGYGFGAVDQFAAGGDYAPQLGALTLLDLGRPIDAGQQIAHVGSAYIGSVSGVGSARYGAGSRIPVVLTQAAIDAADTTQAEWTYLRTQVIGSVALEVARRTAPVEVSGQIIVPGGVPCTSLTVSTAGVPRPLAFAWRPKIDLNATTDATAAVPAGDYWVRVCYETALPNGDIIRSEPSDPSKATLSGTGYLSLFWTNYPLQRADVKIIVYLSTDGTNYYRLDPYTAAISSDWTTYMSSTAIRSLSGIGASSRWLLSSDHLYTDGGVLPATMPPSSYQAIIWQRRVWLVGGHSQLWYSRELVSGEAPAWHPALTVTIAGERIVAAQPINDRLMIWTDKALYSLQGDGPNDVGEGGFQMPVKIADLTIEGTRHEQTSAGTNSVWFYSRDLNLWRVSMAQGGFRTDNMSGALGDWHLADTGGDAPVSVNVDQLTYCQHRRQIRAITNSASYWHKVHHEDLGQWSTYTTASVSWFTGDTTGILVSDAAFAHKTVTQYGYITEMIQERQQDGQYPDLLVDASGVVATGEMPDVAYWTNPIRVDGPSGSERVRRSTWLVRVNDHWSLAHTGVANGDTGSSPSGWTNGTTTTTFDPSATYSEGHAFASGIGAGGLWESRLHHKQQKCASFDCRITATWDGTHGNAPNDLTAGTYISPVEVHGLTVEVGKRQGGGRLSEAQQG